MLSHSRDGSVAAGVPLQVRKLPNDPTDRKRRREFTSPRLSSKAGLIFCAPPIPICGLSSPNATRDTAVIARKHQVSPKRSWTTEKFRANLFGMTCSIEVKFAKREVHMNLSPAWRRHIRVSPVSKTASKRALLPLPAYRLTARWVCQTPTGE